MYPEYLINNDTQDICSRVSELVKSNEPALRENCLEVSRQTDTSSLAFAEMCEAKVREINASFADMMKGVEKASQSLSQGSDVFGIENRQSQFPAICRFVVQIEEKRRGLLSYVAQLTGLRRELASKVADVNRILHFLSLAKRAVSKEMCVPYTEAIARVERAYERLTKADAAIKEVQNFYMTLIDTQLPIFMERLRTAADFNHTGASLDRAAIRALCRELLLLQNRVPNVSF